LGHFTIPARPAFDKPKPEKQAVATKPGLRRGVRIESARIGL